MIVDVHAHLATRELFDLLTAHKVFGKLMAKTDNGYTIGPIGLDPLCYDLEPRLESLERRGVDVQLVGTFNPLLHWRGGAPDVEFARYINADTAKAVSTDKRLWGMATIAFGEPHKAADELRRAVGEYGYRGAHIGISAGERTLDDAVFEPVWSVAEELGLLLFMHPARDRQIERCEDYNLNTIVAYPTETGITISRMIFAGVFERHPDLKLCLAHGGGTLVWLAARLDRGFWAPVYEHNPAQHKQISKRPSEYVRQIYVDTCVFGMEQLDFLLSFMGADHLMLGTDYPFEIADSEGECVAPWLARLDNATRDRINGGNAMAILGRTGS